MHTICMEKYQVYAGEMPSTETYCASYAAMQDAKRHARDMAADTIAERTIVTIVCGGVADTYVATPHRTRLLY